MKAPHKLTDQDIATIKMFTEMYPNWWWKVCVCSRTRDFTAAPEAHAKEAKYIEVGNDFDRGFDVMHEGTVAEAVTNIMGRILTAISQKEREAENV